MVQNMESHGLSGRVDSTVININNGFHLIHTLFSALVEVRDPLKSSIILKQIKLNH